MKRALLLMLGLACGPAPAEGPDASVMDSGVDDAGTVDAGAPDAGVVDAGEVESFDAGPFIAAVVYFDAGMGAGFGQEAMPGIVFGPPDGYGDSAGSLDVVSLGRGGVIEVSFAGDIVDGDGTDFIVFENPFVGWIETGIVSVSEDGAQWFTFPCAAVIDGGTEGCAGVGYVYSSPDNGISPLDPTVAGGDDFDLATLGVTRAHYVRIQDTGLNKYGPPSGGFDLDAIAVVHEQR